MIRVGGFSPDYYLPPEDAMTSFFVHAKVIFLFKEFSVSYVSGLRRCLLDF